MAKWEQKKVDQLAAQLWAAAYIEAPSAFDQQARVTKIFWRKVARAALTWMEQHPNR